MSKLLYRSEHQKPMMAIGSSGSYIEIEGGKKILDAAGGAAVTSVGHSNKQVIDQICSAIQNVQFTHSSLYTTSAAEDLAKIILDKPVYEELGYNKVSFYNSGSEANETAIKIARQACYERGEPQRTKIISRDMSYHGNTFGAMSLSGHKIRNKMFSDMFDGDVFHKVSPPFYFHYKEGSETEGEFCQRLLQELDAKFLELGPDTIIAVVAETMIGGTVGCVMPPKGYFEGVKKICKKYGSYLIYDEIMCGSGRLGSFFAWEKLTTEDKFSEVCPDILTFGKAIGSGYLPLSGVVINEDIIKDIRKGSGQHLSRHTYQAHPVSCAAGLAVQKYIKDNDLYDNINKLGPYLGSLLKSELSEIKEVADVRGMGFFWCVEFLRDTQNSIAFDPSISFTDKLNEICIQNGLSIIPCHGALDGYRGDQILISPSFDIDEDTVQKIVSLLKKSIKNLLATLE